MTNKDALISHRYAEEAKIAAVTAKLYSKNNEKYADEAAASAEESAGYADDSSSFASISQQYYEYSGTLGQWNVGAYSEPPSVRRDGSAIQPGDIYKNTTDNSVYSYNSDGTWSSISYDLNKAQDLYSECECIYAKGVDLLNEGQLMYSASEGMYRESKDLYSAAEGLYSFSENQSSTLSSSDGVSIIGAFPNGLYLGCFFDSWNNNEVFIVTSEDAYNWSNPTRLYYQGVPLTVRDPTLIYYRNKFILLEGGDVDVADCYLYFSDDLVNWDKKPIVFNSDGVTTVFSNTRVWSNGGGSVACSKSWSQEPCIDANGNMYIMASLYTGIDTTSGSTTDNMFKIGISKCLDWDNLIFDYPTLMNLYTDSSTPDIYSRIDPSMHYDASSGNYVLGVKRENYGYVEVFYGGSPTGEFIKSSSISPPSTAPGATMQFEGPSVFGLRDGGIGVSVDEYYGPTGQWLSTSADLETYSDATCMRMPFARHGSVRFYNDLPFISQYYIAIQQLRSSSIREGNERPRFTHYTTSQTIIPVSDTIYWTSNSALTLTIQPAIEQPAKRFYVFVNSGNSSVYTIISGSISGGDVTIGYGVNNYNLVEFVYNATDNKYIASERYNPISLFTTGVLQANDVRSNTGFDMGYGNTTAATRQITAYPLGSNSPTGNIAFSNGLVSIYSNGEVRLNCTTFVSATGYGFKFPTVSVGSLPAAATYQYVEMMCTGMTYASDGTTAISPGIQKVYSDGTNWRLSSSPSTIVK